MVFYIAARQQGPPQGQMGPRGGLPPPAQQGGPRGMGPRPGFVPRDQRPRGPPPPGTPPGGPPGMGCYYDKTANRGNSCFVQKLYIK